MTSSQKALSESNPKIVQWFVDTRPLWPVQQAKPRDEVQQLKTVASRALSLLSESEQASVLKYYHLKDAKMSLVSHLLKRLIITTLDIPWPRSIVSRDSKGKPCFIPEDCGSHVVLDFNVSHQAGLVSLIAIIGLQGAQVGTDIVCANERLQQDTTHISKHGFEDWVDMHADVLADSEVRFMKTVSVDGQPSALGTAVDKELRRFYAVWCLREAYVKMTGDALLAPWLKELEIRDVQAPAAKEGLDSDSLEEGEVVRQSSNYFQGEVVADVKMELSAIGAHYMIAGSIRIPQGVDSAGVKLGKWQKLDFEKDVLKIAEATS
ncbi:uncharacterized protein L3040_006244 [Drepanopeziza brunnea f. sp. 'multigermtubi']|uniref:uncharacterized protein n=1 Tax=Drepanopeziza brunnea f. sp. 'multigermtubi' TaxID=698441 RepID=UPI002391D2D3|nr:hypothetical protein L3040_006244 [Drepanopeziza brunnea f. sp. 'multigermtubi']